MSGRTEPAGATGDSTGQESDRESATPGGRGPLDSEDERESSNDAAADVPEGEETRPAGRDAPREGGADDLQRLHGVGPKLEGSLNDMGIFHFDQIAGWSAREIAWVDRNLEGFKGRVTRDDWVGQAKSLSNDGKTKG